MLRRALLTILLVSTVSSGWAAKLMVNQLDAFGEGYTYGGSLWNGFTTALNNAFGSSNITVSTVAISSATLAGFNAVIVDLRQTTDTLSAGEISALQTFAAGGGRVLLIGEHNSWATWDNSILSVVGGSFSGTATGDENITPVVSNALTAGISSLTLGGDGIATGGTALFSENVATLWTPNIVSLLSVNVEDDETGTPAGNVQFKANLASFLAAGLGTRQSVPALSDWALAMLAIAMIGLVVGLSSRAARARC